MAHFAKLGINSKVISVEVVADDDMKNADGVEDESVGIQFLEHIHGWPLWKQTSYNTRGGKHYDQENNEDDGTPLRKNYAGVGFTYDSSRDAFIPPQTHTRWTLNESTCMWEAPVAYPDDGKDYIWNEVITNWTEIE